MSERAMPVLALVRTTNTATTYQFRASSGVLGSGWALCTVNDGTGELLITSDWGNWSNNWYPPHLGMATLTHFIGERDGIDYLANKLLGRRASERFSIEATVLHFRKEICRRRFHDGQEINGRLRRCGDDERDQTALRQSGLLEKSYGGNAYMTEGQARDLWDAIQSISSDLDDSYPTAETLFIERFYHLDDHALVFDEPYNELQHVESFDSKILRETILPALRDACKAKAREPEYVALQLLFAERQAREQAARSQGAP